MIKVLRKKVKNSKNGNNFSPFTFHFSLFCRTFAAVLGHPNHSDSSAVGSALRSGRRGRAFESPLSDGKLSPHHRRKLFC